MRYLKGAFCGSKGIISTTASLDFVTCKHCRKLMELHHPGNRAIPTYPLRKKSRKKYGYKVCSTWGGVPKSLFCLGPTIIRYPVGKWVEAPDNSYNPGVGIFALRNLKAAKIWFGRGEEPRAIFTCQLGKRVVNYKDCRTYSRIKLIRKVY